MTNDRVSSSSTVLVSFVAGSMAGAALALLFASRSGEDTRKVFKQRIREEIDRGRKARGRFTTRGREVLEGVTEYVEGRKDDLQHQKDRVVSAVAAGRQAYQDDKPEA